MHMIGSGCKTGSVEEEEENDEWKTGDGSACARHPTTSEPALAKGPQGVFGRGECDGHAWLAQVSRIGVPDNFVP